MARALAWMCEWSTTRPLSKASFGVRIQQSSQWIWSCQDGLELIRIRGRSNYRGALILMSGGFELYLKMADEMAKANGLDVVARLPKPFRPKQFACDWPGVR